ncbi:hypothetical protein [Vibrio crassostreae]|uniref:hypothetical protein n=1 Tax=Vibrio crassostreae TaxID=246167 RepID=UPI001B301D98|nr:hypothetical protein [Vibrio crassostreae]
MSTFTKESLVAKLTELSNAAEEAFGEVTADNVDQMDNVASDAREAFLSKMFGGREIFSLFPSEFCVYTNNWEDRTSIVEQAQAMGFKNIHTFTPKVCDGEGGSMDDPKHSLAVRVNAREDLIIGDLAKKFIKINKPFIDVVKEHVIFTYCHSGDYRLTFSDETVAMLLVSKLNKYLETAKAKVGHKLSNIPNLTVRMEKENLDNFRVWITLNAED